MAFEVKQSKPRMRKVTDIHNEEWEEYSLKPNDSHKSFYGKAHVIQRGDKKILRSYDTDVAEIENGKAKVFGLYSQTTTRHIKAFLIENGFKAESSKQIMADYGVKNNASDTETKFGTMNEKGEIKDSMSVNLSKVNSPDPLAYSFGFNQGKSGQEMDKASKGDKLASEYVRGYKDGLKEKQK